MNDELESQLAKVVEKALEVAEKSGDFVIEQAPLLLQEFYMWHIIKYALWILIPVVFFIISSRFLNSFGKKETFEIDTDPGYSWNIKINAIEYCSRFYSSNESIITVKISKYFIGFLSFGIVCHSIYKIVFITVAPKLYLLDYFIN